MHHPSPPPHKFIYCPQAASLPRTGDITALGNSHGRARLYCYGCVISAGLLRRFTPHRFFKPGTIVSLPSISLIIALV